MASGESDAPIWVNLAAGSSVVGAVTQSGTWTVQPGNTQNTTPWLVNVSAALPTGTNTIGAVNIAASQTLGTVTTVSTVTNLAQLGGTAVSMNTGTRDAGTQRVTIATNDVVPASQSGTWTVQPGNTANTTAWKVDGSAVTQPVSGTFWQATQPVSGTFWQATQPVSGTVTANAGTNLNTSLLALEAGGNLATIVTNTNKILTRYVATSDTYTSNTNGVTQTVTTAPLKSFSVAVKATGGIATTWDVRLEGSLDGTNWTGILQHTNLQGDGITVFSGSNLYPVTYFRSRCAGLLLGAASNIVVSILGIN